MFDLRSKQEHHSCQIRDSFCVDGTEGNSHNIMQFIEDAEKKYSENEKKYNTKPIRRAFFIDTKDKTYSESEEKTKLVLDCIKVFYFIELSITC